MTDSGLKAKGVVSLLTARRTFLLKDSHGEIPSNMYWGTAELEKWGIPVQEIAPALYLKNSSLLRGLVKFFGVNFIYLFSLLRERRAINKLGAIYTITPNGAQIAVLLRAVGLLDCRIILYLTGFTMFTGGGLLMPLKRKILSWWFSRMDHIMLVTRFEVNGLKRNISNGESIVAFAPLGVDLEFYRPADPRLREDNFILIIGNDENRDWSTALKIGAACPQLKFRIITNYFNGRAVQMPENCTYLGNPPFAESRKAFENAAVVLIVTKPSTYFSGITTILAAMASGAVVITDDSKSAEDYEMTEGKNYLKYERGDIEGAAKCLHSVLSDSELRSSLRDAAYKNVANYSMDRFAAAVGSQL